MMRSFGTGWRMAAMVFCFATWKAWGAPLVLQQNDNETASTIRCSHPKLLRHSTFEAELSPGSDFIAYCSFAFSPTSGRPNVTWHHGHGDFLLNRNAAMSTEWRNSSSASSQQTVTAKISIANISSHDQGVYTARVWNHCGAKAECNIHLSTMSDCYQVIPTVKGTKYDKKIVVPDRNSHKVSIQVEYSGDADSSHFDVLWQLNSSSNFADTDERFQSRRKQSGSCSFTETLTINDASHLDSGRYTAYVSQYESSTNATIDLQIIPWPIVTGWPGENVHLNKTRILSYQMSFNFTEFISLVGVKDDAVIENGNSIVIRHHQLEYKNITVDVTVPKEAAGRYKLCYSFIGNVSITNVSTSQQQPWYCTSLTTVTTELPRSKATLKFTVTALSVAIGTFVFIFTACLAVIKLLKSWRSRNPQNNEETKPLVPHKKSNHFQGGYGGQSPASPFQGSYGGQSPTSPFQGGYGGQSPTSPSIMALPVNDPEDDISTDRSRHQYDSVARDTGKSTPLWVHVPATIIDSPNMVSIAREVGRWETLARCLGLSEPDVVAIQENYKGDHEERKYQMILKWCQRNGSEATLQKLVRCVEVNFGDRKLAERIFNCYK